MHQAICPKRSYCDASFDENCCFLVLLRKPFDSQPVTNVLPEQSCQEMWLLHMLSFSACSTETVSTHFGLILSHLSSLGKFSFSLKWRKKLSRAPGIDSYDLLIKCSETDEELGMEDNMDYFENENEKKILSKGSSPCDICLAFTPRLHLRSKIPMNPHNKDSIEWWCPLLQGIVQP